MFIIQHMYGRVWRTDCIAEARLYALGGILCPEYTVFRQGFTHGLCAFEI